MVEANVVEDDVEPLVAVEVEDESYGDGSCPG